MKKIFLTLCVALFSVSMFAEGLEGVKIYVNPGHGSWDPGTCRGMSTIPYQIDANGVLDTCGFFESNTNLWKSTELAKKLRVAGADVFESRTANGPYPFPGSSLRSEYQARDDRKTYDRELAEIREEVEVNGYDYFISIHSNATSEGTTTNYPLLLYRGYDDESIMSGDSKERAKVLWPYLFEAMDAGIDPYTYYSKTNPNVRGDISFMGGSDTAYINGNTYVGYYGVLRHGVPGYLSEGYFHTYQPARHRALNKDYCAQEGVRYYRGIAAYYNHPAETVGYIMGTVKDLHEKMNHPLFTYNPKTNDDWVPCNGAEVILYKAGVEVAKYKVDNNYNGVFVFSDLEPGADYTLDVTCEGYKPIFAEYAEEGIYYQGQQITVKANETTYPFIRLESTTYEPPKIVYTDYPNPVQPDYAVVPSTLHMTQKVDSMYAIEGTIKRIIGVGDSTIVLSHTEDKVAHLYLIDHLTGVIAPISTEGIVADTENAGEYLALSDIAYTCDGYLVACNYIRCQYDDDKVDAGQKRGYVHFYKWDRLDTVPELWVESNHSSNSFRSEQGYTLSISGPTDDCTIFYTGAHNRTLGVRFTELTVADNQIVSSNFHMESFEEDEEGSLTPNKVGNKYLLTLSPRDTKASWIFDANKIPAFEGQLVGTNKDLKIMGTFPEEAYGKVFTQTNFFKYAGRIISIAPYEVDGKVGGVRLYDVTDGLDKPVLIKTTNTDLAEPIAADFAAATAKVSGLDITIYLVIDGKVMTFTSVGETKPVNKGVFAYGLNMTAPTDSSYTFSFTANDDAVAANIVFYNLGKEVGKVAIPAVVKGANELTLLEREIPGEEGMLLTWGIELQGEAVTDWNVLYKETAYEFGRTFNAVDISPESDYFGQIYVQNRFASSAAQCGNVYIYDQNWNLQNTTPYTGGFKWGNPARLVVGEDGMVYFADWADNLGGIYLMDPANPNEYKQFFQGERDGNCVFWNNDQAVGSSSPGVGIYGSGADTKLIVYNEDPAGTLPKNGIAIYNIGQEDGSLLRTWDKAPSTTHAITGQANSEGGIWGTSHGYFVTQNRGKGNNNTGADGLKFYDYDGNQQFSSAVEPYKDIFDGNNGSSVAVSRDESMLIANNGSPEFLVFDIEWEGNKPVLTLRYRYEHGLALANIRAMSFDYAGNLVITGENGMRVMSVPTADNSNITPAKKALTIRKAGVRKATALELSEAALALRVEDEATLKATILPLDATAADAAVITWESDKPEVATIVDGKITAVGIGDAIITATATAEGMETLKATCAVNVQVKLIAATGVTLSAELDTLNVTETLTLTAIVAPVEANELTTTWASDKPEVATVVDGVVTAVAPGEAIITVSVQNEIMAAPVTATCKVVVLQPVTGVVLSAERDTLKIGDELTLEVTIAPEDAAEPTITWTSSNPEVATVADGVVTAVAEGEAIITVNVINAAMTEALTATCTIVVEKDPTTGELTIDIASIYYANNTIHNPQGLALQVFNVNGQLVATGNGDINMSSAANGLYIVNCQAGVLKFVK